MDNHSVIMQHQDERTREGNLQYWNKYELHVLAQRMVYYDVYDEDDLMYKVIYTVRQTLYDR